MKAKEIRKLSDKKLLQLLEDLKFELVRVRSTGTLDDKKARTKGLGKKNEKTSIQREIKRTIAKILTILNEREVELNNGMD